jgi:Protein of unknown function (DUF1254)
VLRAERPPVFTAPFEGNLYLKTPLDRFFALDKGPIVFQVPDFEDRFWVYPFYDARTDEFSEIGQQYGTKPATTRGYVCCGLP